MLSMEELRRMQKQDIMELDRKKLANAKDVVIDMEKSVEGRIQSFIEQTGNPFAQNVGEYIVQVGYREDTNEQLDDRMVLLLRRMAQLTLPKPPGEEQEGWE